MKARVSSGPKNALGSSRHRNPHPTSTLRNKPGIKTPRLAQARRGCLNRQTSKRSELTPDRILNTAFAFGSSKALLSAVEVGVLTQLYKGRLTLDELIARVELHPRGARDFLDAPVPMRMSLNMLIENEAGFDYTGADCQHGCTRRDVRKQWSSISLVLIQWWSVIKNTVLSSRKESQYVSNSSA